MLFFAILFAFGLQALGERGKALLNVIDQASYALFGVVGIIMKVAPIGAFGAMAFTIGKYGVVTLLSLAKLMVAFYATCIIFVVVRARLLRLAGRIQHLQVHPLHQGRAADRARHILLGVGAAAHDRQDGESGL